MTYETLIFDKKNSVAVVTINRPQALNALNDQVLTELGQVLQEIDKDKALTAVILTGGGEKAFVAGADIKAFESMSPMQAVIFAEKGQRVFRMIEILKIPVIAAVNGFALGGGCELAVSCDFIIASSKSKFGLPEVSLGLIPGFGGTQRLARFVGLPRARELILTGRMMTAEESLQAGLVNRVVAPESLMSTCFEITDLIAQRSPIAVSRAKETINMGYDLPLDEGLHHERDAFSELFRSRDVSEGVKAFIEKRKPQFQQLV